MPRRKRTHPDPSHLLPPAPDWPRDESLLLRETDPPLALLLWQRARDVRLWATIPAGALGGLFTAKHEVERTLEEGGAFAPCLADSLRALGALVRYPELLSPADVCAACINVSAWVDASHMPERRCTSRAAALADPVRAEATALAGSACVQRGEHQRAVVWLARAVRIARRTEDWVWYARSQIRFGRLLYEQGELGRARRCYERAHRKAVWSGHYDCAAKAHHDLLLIECSGGTYRDAEAHALRALELYPVRSRRLPHLAQDFAYLLTCHGAYTDALELLDVALPLLTRPDERIAAYATTAKASAGATQSDRHIAASEDVLLLASLSDVNAAGALMLAAEGAHILGDWERAGFLAAASIHVAERRQEREPLERAQKVLAAATRLNPSVPIVRTAPPERVNGPKAAFLMRLKKLRAPAEDAETRASPRGRDCTGVTP